MKHMRKILGILAVLLLCTAFVGAGSAFTYSSNDAVVTPSGALTAGQTVTATMVIKIAGGSLTDSDRITLSTPLSNPKWSTDVCKGDQVSVNDYESASISGFMVGGKSDVTLKISLSGVVSAASEGKEISVLKITATNKETNGYTSFSTKAQKVYDKGNFAGDLAAVEKDISNLEKRVAAYTSYGVNTATINETIKQATTKYSAAKSAGTGNLITAYANIEAAETLLAKAERDLAYAGLTLANKNLAQINAITSTLYGKGWDTEAQYLETKSVTMKYTYDSLAATYNSGGTPEAAKVDALVTDTVNTLAKANEYLEEANVPVIVKILPFIGGGIVLAGAIVGIIFLIRRRRNNSWDELG